MKRCLRKRANISGCIICNSKMKGIMRKMDQLAKDLG